MRGRVALGLLVAAGGCGGRADSPATPVIPVVPDGPARVVSVVVAPANVSLGQDQEQPLTATVRQVGGLPELVIWRSSNPRAATVNAQGVVRSGCAGSSIITALSVADTTRTAQATILVGAVLLPQIQIGQVNVAGAAARLDRLKGMVGVVLNTLLLNTTCDGMTEAFELLVVRQSGDPAETVVATHAGASPGGPLTMSFDTSPLANGDYRIQARRRMTDGRIVVAQNSVAVTIAN
ncbi:MAG: hypothetical protein JWO05_3353 [Gemmatimonadetes bacterium]|nr:hypothetical protein [Gemmatimonadota bacterium]